MHGERSGVRPAAMVIAVMGLLAAVLASTAPSARAQEAPAVTSQVVTSFDGTPIVTTLFVPAGVTDADPAPLVLRTHGWGGTGQRDASGFVGDLLDAGYVVLTWDQRGFGCSGGEVTVDNPDVEGRDVQALIDWTVANAPIQTDGAGDPLVGMTGGSYAGGIQTATAAVDDRIDAIVPQISWSDLRYSLYSGNVVNRGWSALLYAAGLATATGLGLQPDCATFPQAGGLDPHITQGFLEGVTTGSISQSTLDFFAASSLAAYGTNRPVAVPTLVIQGSTDTLFDLTDGYRIVEHVRAAGAPARFMVFCGGHVACPSTYADADDSEHIDAAVLAWLERYLRGDGSIDDRPMVEYRTNEGVWRTATDFPTADGGPVTASGSGSGSLLSVPIVEIPDVEAIAGQLADFGGGIPALPITSAQVSAAGDPRAMTIEVAAATDGPIEMLGIPTVQLTVSGVGTEVVLMAKLVDREAGHVVNLQEGAVRVPLLAGPTTVEVPMPGVAYTLPAGHHLDLQVSTASLMHINARAPAQVDVTATVSVPADVAADPTAPPAAEPPGDPSAPDPLPTPALPETGSRPSPLVPLALAAISLGVLWRLRLTASGL